MGWSTRDQRRGFRRVKRRRRWYRQSRRRSQPESKRSPPLYSPDSSSLIVKTVPHSHHKAPPPDNYTLALHKALKFFNAQKSGKLPRHNNVSWRGNSGLQDGKGETGTFYKDLVGGYYDAGDATQHTHVNWMAPTGYIKATAIRRCVTI